MSSQERVSELSGLLRRNQISRRDFVQGLLVLGFSTAGVAALLEACSTGGGSVAGASPSPSAQVNTFGSGSTVISLWDGLGGPDGDAFNTMLKAYAQANPDVQIKREVLDWGVFYQKVPTAVLAGSPPDLIVNDAYGMPPFASRGMLQPIGDMVLGAAIPKNDFTADNLLMGTWQGTIYSIPLWNPIIGFWMNNDLVRKAGLDPTKPPATGDEFASWATRLTLDSSGKRADQAGFDPKNVQQYGVSMGWFFHSQLSSLWQFGGDVTNQQHSSCTLSTPESLASVNYWVDLVKRGVHVPIDNPGVPATGPLYQSERLAMVVEGSWWLGFFTNTNKQLLPPKTTMWGLPQWGPKQKAVWYTAHLMSIPKGIGEKRTAAAAKLVSFLADASGTGAPLAGHLPARISQQANPDVASSWWLKPLSQEQSQYGRLEWYGPRYNQINTDYVAAWDTALTLQGSAQSALQNAANVINPLLA